MNLVRLSQWDKVVMTLVLACLLPLGLHALPLASASDLGVTWLPIFYAPLIASLYFRPHVSLLAGLCAPVINHVVFGMPSDRILLPLTFELVIFSAIVLLLRRRFQPSGWMVAGAYALTLAGALLIFSHAPLGEVVPVFLRSMATAMPGILILVVLTEIVRYFNKRQEP
jgi:hypothetical protein